MKATIEKLQKKIDVLIDKVPDKDYINVNTIKSLSAAILDLSLAEKTNREVRALNK